jgi:hypothetical protein
VAQTGATHQYTSAQQGTLLPNSGAPFEINVLAKADQTSSPAKCHASVTITPAS